MPAAQSGLQRFSHRRPCPVAPELAHVVQVMSWTPIPASAQVSVMMDGRVLAGPTQLATTPGSAPDVAGTELAGVAVPGAAIAVADVDGGVGADAGEVVGDAEDDTRGVVVAEAAGMLEVLLLFGVHAVAARASPSTAPAPNFPKK